MSDLLKIYVNIFSIQNKTILKIEERAFVLWSIKRLPFLEIAQ